MVSPRGIGDPIGLGRTRRPGESERNNGLCERFKPFQRAVRSHGLRVRCEAPQVTPPSFVACPSQAAGALLSGDVLVHAPAGSGKAAACLDRPGEDRRISSSPRPDGAHRTGRVVFCQLVLGSEAVHPVVDPPLRECSERLDGG